MFQNPELAAAGFVCMLFSFWFTAYAAKAAYHAGGQSIRDSVQEAWMNVVIGFTINYIVNIFILPWAVEAQLTGWNNFWMGWIYTAISFIRQIGLRRAYNLKMLIQQGKVTAPAWWGKLSSLLKGVRLWRRSD